jgi:hypothetical protein
MHDRMPVIIPSKDYDRWLKLGDPDRPPIDLLRTFDAEKMRAWRVNSKVGNVRNDTPDLIEQSPDTQINLKQAAYLFCLPYQNECAHVTCAKLCHVNGGELE